MSFSAYPSSDMATPFAYLCCLYNGPFSYTSEANVSPISNPAFFSYQPTAPSMPLELEIPNVIMEAQKNLETYPEQRFYSVQSNNLQQELSPNQTTTNSRIISGGSKSSEIWRPFSPSPMKENPNDISGINITLSPITSSRVKIEHSKTSLFKPVKKKGFRCSHCSSSFINSAQLISHLRVHTGSKPFTCEYPNCSKTFARNEELTRHLRIHSGYKPHACRDCGKTFGRKDHLSKHSKTHLNAAEKRAYACAVPGCGHRYTRSDALARHRTAAHAIWQKKRASAGGQGRE